VNVKSVPAASLFNST